jgi:hypothetical protein
MFKIISADERLKSLTGVKMVIMGGFGIGKTSLLKTIKEPTLCLDFEAGLLAVQDWKGSTISVRTWQEAKDLACLIGGPNPALKPDAAYSTKHYNALKATDQTNFDEYKVFFIDSLTVASRLCLQWCKAQPEAFSERTGKLDTRAAYGLLASEMISWLNQFQYIPNKDVIFVGLLEQKADDLNKLHWSLQCEGSKTAQEIPGILDEVISMVADDKGQRVFVCQTINQWEYPAKDRSGRLDLVEPAHLGNLLTKIRRN